MNCASVLKPINCNYAVELKINNIKPLTVKNQTLNYSAYCS